MMHTIHELAEDIRRQVKKHREQAPQAQQDPQGRRTHARAHRLSLTRALPPDKAA